jgi:hypothetical protein
MFTRRYLHFGLAFAAMLSIGSITRCFADKVAVVQTKDRAFFEKKIRPVLVKYCYSCHAKGAKKIGGKLWLDRADALRKGGESGPVVVPGQPEKSLLIQSLRYEHIEMPPKQPLPKSVVKDFELWIKMGAPDPRGEKTKPTNNVIAVDLSKPEFWSFRPIVKPDLPDVRTKTWLRDPLDRFVLAKLEAKGLTPTSDATARTLARRLYVDLIGLPPSLEQVSTFESAYRNNPQQAAAQLVDELLASPQFGERWGRHWLDVARYGESNGNDGLGRNPTFPHAWRYRDYVINALNADVPYDRFITEQIAGDLLPAKTPAQRDKHLIATGFLALGSKPAKAMNENFDMDIVDDQINVVSTGVMGLSVACARCHDHKHDPIPTRDYYALAGIFKSTQTLWGKAANEKLTAPATPLHELKATPLKPKDKANATPIQQPKINIAPKFAADYDKAIKSLKPALYAPLNIAGKTIKPEANVKLSKTDFADLRQGRIKADVKPTSDAYTISFWFMNVTPNSKQPVTAYLFSFGQDSKGPAPGDHLGISGTANKNAPGKLFIFNGNKRKQSVTGSATIPARTWNHVVYVRDGNRVLAYLNGNPKPDFDGQIDRTASDANMFFIGGRNDRFANLRGRIAHFAFFPRAVSATQAQQLHASSGQPRGSSKPLPASLVQGEPEKKSVAQAMGVRDRAKPADCKINVKGESKKLGPLVPRGYLSACKTDQTPTAVNSKQSGRLELAKWLTSGQHPQTARVMVNRIWLHLFGQAIVSTPDDFGVYGSRPTHPQLLDHLAARFVEDKWSIKRMIRTIVLSRTYQLSSRADDRLLTADPENVFYTRHRRRRFDAESIRDAMLLVSGQLNRASGNGSAIQHLDVLVNKSDNLHRPSNHRSVYLCMLRNSPPPQLAAFDLPQFIAVTGQRNITTLPTQALFLLNNPFVVKQAKHMAQLVLASSGNASDESKISWLYRRTLNREPTASELHRAGSFIGLTYQDLSRENQGNSSKKKTDAQTLRLNAWATLCQALLATNEFRYVD